MDATRNTDNLAETLLMEILKTTPTAYLGLPPTERGQDRDNCQTAHIMRLERLEKEREARFVKLKDKALANIRKAE